MVKKQYLVGCDFTHSAISLKQAEEKTLEYVNRIGAIMVDEVVGGLKEPV